MGVELDIGDAPDRIIRTPCHGRAQQWSGCGLRRCRTAGARPCQGCGLAWRLLPSDFPPWATVYRWFAAWRDDCVFEKLNHARVMADREHSGRDSSPLAAIIDSRSVQTTEHGGPRCYDAGKKINGHKRHALVATDSRALISSRIR
jgi:transposase